MLTNKQIADFQKHYQTEVERFHIPFLRGFTRQKIQPTDPEQSSPSIVRKWYPQNSKITVASRSDFTRKGVIALLKRWHRHPNLRQKYGALCCRAGASHCACTASGCRHRTHFSGRNDIADTGAPTFYRGIQPIRKLLLVLFRSRCTNKFCVYQPVRGLRL